MQQQVLKSRGMQIVEHRLGQPLDIALAERYSRDGMTVDAIASELGVTKGTISRWLAHFGIQTRYLRGDREALA